ncbi:hypothetical protein RN001_013296 [Aquatica leii]|uniref:Uncharacterized protein n=1 Tax=Aquatica leii TaxID=1421715 RepID=A0AAN7P487_9COLE|nr:hypothetical protein RN001_013296 [Aquatica leii]
MDFNTKSRMYNYLSLTLHKLVNGRSWFYGFTRTVLIQACVKHKLFVHKMSHRTSNPVILSFHESLLRLSDIDLLRGPCWLNDSIISFYFEYLEVNRFRKNPLLVFVHPQNLYYRIVVDSYFLH